MHAGKCVSLPQQQQLLTQVFCVSRANCSEYFPLFIILLWTSGVFFQQGESDRIGVSLKCPSQ